MVHFSEIDVDEIEHAAECLGVHRIVCHGRGENEDALDRRVSELGVHPVLQPCVMEVAERQRLAGAPAEQGFQFGAAWMERETREIGAHRLQRGQMLPVGGIVDEAAEVHAMGLRQVAEHVPGADLIALVRWIRHTMRQEQEIFHRSRPSLLLRGLFGTTPCYQSSAGTEQQEERIQPQMRTDARR